MEYTVVITETAVEDIATIGEHITDVLLEAHISEKLIAEFYSSILSLAKMPHRHELIKDRSIVEREIRRIYVEQYIVFYHVRNDENIVQVLRVIYGKRSWIDLI